MQWFWLMVRSWIKIHALSCSGNVGKGSPFERVVYLGDALHLGVGGNLFILLSERQNNWFLVKKKSARMTELGGRGLKCFFWQRPNRHIFHNWGLPKVMRERSYEQILFLFLSGTRFMFPPPCCMTNRGITPGSSVVAPVLRLCSSYSNRTTSTSTIIRKYSSWH